MTRPSQTAHGPRLFLKAASYKSATRFFSHWAVAVKQRETFRGRWRLRSWPAHQSEAGKPTLIAAI